MVKIWNCSPSSVTEDGTDGAVEAEVVGTGSGDGVGDGSALGSFVAEGEGDEEADVEGEGEGVTSSGPIPVIENELEQPHVTPTSTMQPAEP